MNIVCGIIAIICAANGAIVAAIVLLAIAVIFT